MSPRKQQLQTVPYSIENKHFNFMLIELELIQTFLISLLLFYTSSNYRFWLSIKL